jgi:hypothetical protein
MPVDQVAPVAIDAHDAVTRVTFPIDALFFSVTVISAISYPPFITT